MSGASVGERLRRWVAEELAELQSDLRHAAHGRGRSLHKARKRLQHLRAAVRLFATVDPELARAENLALRTLRRRLGRLRDAAARAETLRLLASRKRWLLWRGALRRVATIELGLPARA